MNSRLSLSLIACALTVCVADVAAYCASCRRCRGGRCQISTVQVDPFVQASQAFWAQADELDAMLKGVESAEKATIEQLKAIVCKFELVRAAAANCKATGQVETLKAGVENRCDNLGKAVAQLCQLAGHSELMNVQVK